VFVAVANIFSKQVTNQTSPLVLTVGRLFSAGIFLLILTLLFFNQKADLLTFTIWSVLSGLLWGFNIAAYNFAMHKIGVTLALSILMLGPVVTMILEYFVLKHIFSPIQIIAAFVVITCGIVMIKSK
jgi:drug/metabolite transporter (DMT)-like permease